MGTLVPAYEKVLDTKSRSSYRHVTRWFNTIVNQKEVAEVVGKVTMCDKEATFVAPAGGKKEAGAGKADKKAKQEKPKEEKKKEEVEDEPLAVAPKKTDPLDALPKGTFD